MADTSPIDSFTKNWDARLRDELAKESDRAAVILGATFLDSALELMLKAYLVPTPSSHDALFEGVSAPFGDFSGRIEAAFRLGLISGSFASALHLVRRIRNQFAHNIAGCSFEDPSVRSRLLELGKCIRIVNTPPDIRARFPSGSRGEFELAASLLQWLLHARTQRIVQLSSSRWEPHVLATPDPAV
jgi:hypothetical protein